MNKTQNLLGVAIIALGLILSLAYVALSQDFCKGNFDYDKDVDGTDASNFKSDFGRSSLLDPCPPDGPSPVAKTGRTGSVITGDDGDLERGLPWPMPRFTDNGNGTVTDNLTGLIWMKHANCFGVRNWNGALDDCDWLSSGYCELTDGSSSGDWRLPNRFELESLLDLDYLCIFYPPTTTTSSGSTTSTIPCHVAIPNTAGDGPLFDGDPFTNCRAYWYWSSTTTPHVDYNPYTNYAWAVDFAVGHVNYNSTSSSNYVWCVRGGQ